MFHFDWRTRNLMSLMMAQPPEEVVAHLSVVLLASSVVLLAVPFETSPRL
jgi:hypothetical protein